MHKELIKIAKNTRAWALSFWDDTSLCGLCARTSGRIWYKLHGLHLNARICVAEQASECHCFVISNGILVDVTASQFGERAIIVEDMRKTDYNWFWRSSFYFKTLKSFIVYQNETGWPMEQRAELDAYSLSNIL